MNTSLTPGGATRIRSGSTPSSSVVSAAVKAELTKMTSQVLAAFAYLRPCIDCVRFVVHSGKRTGTRS